MHRVAVYILLCFCVVVYATVGSSVYSWNEIVSDPEWTDVQVRVLNETAHTELMHKILPRPVKGRVDLVTFVSQPVYVTMTTMHTRIHNVHNTVHNILHGTVLPTKIFLFISKEPYLLDKASMLSPMRFCASQWSAF